MTLVTRDPIEEICHRRTVKDSDVALLRRMIFARPAIEPADVEMLFRINESTRLQDPAWSELFIEAITDYVVNELPPQGYVTASNAAWLNERIDRDGRVDSITEIELLVAIIDKARWVPESLVKFALQQVKHAVIQGDGPLRSGARLSAGKVTADEVSLLKRLLYAFGGNGNVRITRSEAEILFDIEDATSDQPQCPEWGDLFVKAIGSAILAASGYTVASREEAMRRDDWLSGRGELSIGNFLDRMLKGARQQNLEDQALARLERQRVEIITNEAVTEADAAWLAERINRDGKLTTNERSLLAFLQREAGRIHPSLQPLLERATRAA